MSFFSKFGVNIYKNCLPLLSVTCPLPQPIAAAIASRRGLHIMTNLRPASLGVTGLTTDINGITCVMQRLLTPVTSILTQVAAFKVKGRLRRRCKDCYFVMRQQRLYVICPTHRRHKQMAMKKRDHNTWILTHATQSKVRPY